MWALDDCQGYAKDGKKYFDTCYEYHRVFWERGIDCDVVSPKADLSRYAIVAAPMLYLTDGETADNLKRYVEEGGTLVGTYMLGTVEEHDLCWLGGFPGGGLRDVFGVWAEEIDTLYPHERQHAVLDGAEHELVDYCEVIHPEGAETLAVYTDGYYQGMSAVTAHRWGKGLAVYQACRDSGTLKEALFARLIEETGISSPVVGELPHGVTAHTRTDGKRVYVFVENYSDRETVRVPLAAPMTDLLTAEVREECTLPPYSFGVFRWEK